MSERPTIKIELPITKKVVILKEWITGREYEVMQEPIFNNADDKNVNKSDFMKTVIHKSLETFLVSIDGVSENVLELALDLPYQDYDFVLQEINSLKKKD